MSKQTTTTTVPVTVPVNVPVAGSGGTQWTVVQAPVITPAPPVITPAPPVPAKIVIVFLLLVSLLAPQAALAQSAKTPFDGKRAITITVNKVANPEQQSFTRITADSGLFVVERVKPLVDAPQTEVDVLVAALALGNGATGRDIRDANCVAAWAGVGAQGGKKVLINLCATASHLLAVSVIGADIAAVSEYDLAGRLMSLIGGLPK